MKYTYLASVRIGHWIGGLRPRYWLPALLLLAFALSAVGTSHAPNMATFPDPSGMVQSFSTSGAFDMSSPFFANLGANGRDCSTCHQASDGWTVTPAHVQARFQATQGLDPIFRPVDGATCPTADVSTPAARQVAYSMLLNKGLIRVSIGVPDGADFRVTSIQDPYNCPQTTAAGLALFRRPLPATNLKFLTTVMWDGRESPAGMSLNDALKHQAMDATTGHAQAPDAPSDAVQQAIVDFESASFTGQSHDGSAAVLNAQGATGGPVALSSQQFFPGINDPLGGNPTGAPFNPKAFMLFGAWGNLKSSPHDPLTDARASIARGEALFNTLPITISGVAGLNGVNGLPASFVGSCTTCHNTPNVGDHSVPLAINIGVTDYPAMAPLDTTGLPVYELTCNDGRVFHVTDPGRALITGHCNDIGKTKGPILRGLASRAPYFHNGSAATLMDAVDFYNNRFHLQLTDQQKQDLVAFLNAL